VRTGLGANSLTGKLDALRTHRAEFVKKVLPTPDLRAAPFRLSDCSFP
jgi:hypothetical protein